ncbi:hypothetical protein HPB48_011586 [Haemaphysalis longicornis]|uniref:Uncharacterized protein n=1 Tax=Haemaphysalis longicornis TaxID=44386 RepID=A0A9J6GI01_HAELO|nr:hypothetical protein HPB48_011586 [Haemaphysalis longicornis]
MKTCVYELVTKNGRPFRLVDGSEFRLIIDPALEALGDRLAIRTNTAEKRVQGGQAKESDNFFVAR